MGAESESGSGGRGPSDRDIREAASRCEISTRGFDPDTNTRTVSVGDFYVDVDFAASEGFGEGSSWPSLLIALSCVIYESP